MCCSFGYFELLAINFSLKSHFKSPRIKGSHYTAASLGNSQSVQHYTSYCRFFKKYLILPPCFSFSRFCQAQVQVRVPRWLLGPLRNSAGVNPDPNRNSNCSKATCPGSLIMVSFPGLMNSPSPQNFSGL